MMLLLRIIIDACSKEIDQEQVLLLMAPKRKMETKETNFYRVVSG